MSVKTFFQNLFKKEPEVKKEPEETKSYTGNNLKLFWCHHCGHGFTVESKDVFPTSVRLLYKDQFVTGKGVMCPKCKQNSIFG